jgi:putative oxidoreductase
MSTQATPSPNGAFSCLDGVAASATDLWLLVGRVALCWIFLAIGWGHVGNIAGLVGYMTSLKAPAPELLAWPAAIAEIIIAITLLFGVATRYGAALAIIFLIISTALAHRYWEYTGPAVGANYNNFLKNLSMLGGMLYVFVIGPGRFSVDGMMRKK